MDQVVEVRPLGPRDPLSDPLPAGASSPSGIWCGMPASLASGG